MNNRVLLYGLFALLFLICAFLFYQVQKQQAMIAELLSRKGIQKTSGKYVDEYIAGPVKNRILKGYSEIQQCYKEFLRKKPVKTNGTVTIDWQIDTDGTVLNPAVVTSNIPDDDLKNCMIQKIAKWTFPEPLVKKYVVHRFVFKKKEPNP